MFQTFNQKVMFSASCLRESNIAVDRYRSPKLGNTTYKTKTIIKNISDFHLKRSKIGEPKESLFYGDMFRIYKEFAYVKLLRWIYRVAKERNIKTYRDEFSSIFGLLSQLNGGSSCSTRWNPYLKKNALIIGKSRVAALLKYITNGGDFRSHTSKPSFEASSLAVSIASWLDT